MRLRIVTRRLTPALQFLAAVAPLLGQGALPDYQRAEQFLPEKLKTSVTFADVEPHWTGDGDRFWYCRGEKQYLFADPEKKLVRPASEHEHAAAKQEEKYENRSPNGRWAAFVENHNLYLRDLSSGTTLELTNDGQPGWDYATPLPSLRQMIEQRTEDVRQRAAVFWSPDSSRLVTYRIDSRQSGRFTSLQFVPPDQLRPKAFRYVYPLPGEVLAKATPIVFDVLQGARIEVKSTALELPFQEGPEFDWLPDSKRFFYTYCTRGCKSLELRLVDGGTGEQKVVLEESSDKYVDPGETFMEFVDETGEVISTSERDGWNHLYLWSNTGKLENPITSGAWVVRRIVRIDGKQRIVYFLGAGREKNEDPYQTHLYRAGFDGSNLQLLTPGNANHTIHFSPSGKFFVDNESRPDLPGRSVLRSAHDGSEVLELEKGSADALLKRGWKFPQAFRGKAEDGSTDLFGLMWLPSNFDPAKKYPIVEQIYPGPHGFFVPKTFERALRGSEQSMAELGFVVVMIDGRGTIGRSQVFHQFSYHNLGGVFGDHVAMIRQLAAKHSFIDLSRVGVYGTSAGAYAAAHAMLMFPDFYKVCVSISGDHDARLDKAWWNELYQGFPVGKDYQEQSNSTLASRLKGHLLLLHGDVDENVHPAETMRFVAALIQSNKNFDMLFVPNMFHGEGSDEYLIRRRWDYFVQHLLGVTPPAKEISSNPSGHSK